MDVFEELVRARNTGKKCALATIVETEGSIPSFQSAKMLIHEDGTMVGTIGGGCTEAEVWQAARDVIETEKPRMLRFSLNQQAAYDNGLICGGQLNVYVEPVLPVPTAFIFGGGHISKSLSKVAATAGFKTVVVDDREQYANRERFPEAAEVHATEYEEAFRTLDINSSSHIVIVTRGHKDDMTVLRLAAQTDARYIGMIGSKRKTIEVVKHLLKEGVPLKRLERVHAPMGLDIGAVTPEEIAVAVTAEMIHARRRPGDEWNLATKAIFAEGVPRAIEIHADGVEAETTEAPESQTAKQS